MNVYTLFEYDHTAIKWDQVWDVEYVESGIYTLPCRLNMHDDAITVVLHDICNSDALGIDLWV